MHALLAAGSLRSVYQPIVALETGDVVGHEALIRGPAGSPYEMPNQLFGSARRENAERELDIACQRAALTGALEAGAGRGQALFLNVEPGLLGERPRDLRELEKRALERFPLFVEFTERSLTDRPPELLAAACELRERGIGIALDDVGADHRSLALMPVLRPDVIKLDLRLVQERPSGEIAEIVHAVNAQAERTGADILAEGIETESQRRTALALGARYGQGWLFGRPGELLPAETPVSAEISRGGAAPPQAAETPFEVVAARRPVRRGPKRLLLALSRQIEAYAESLGPSALVLSTFQEARYFSAPTAERYQSLAERTALVAAIGVGLPETPAPGVRGVTLAESDPLRGEWDVVVIGPHFAAAFTASDLGDSGEDMRRNFDFALTYERDLALKAAASLLARIAPLR